MNSKTVLFLLGSACLLALVQFSAGYEAPGAAKAAATEAGRAPGMGGRHGPGGKGFDFRKEVEQIFNEFKVDPATRDNILDRIKQRMEELHAKGGFRRRKEAGKGKGKGGDKDKKQ